MGHLRCHIIVLVASLGVAWPAAAQTLSEQARSSGGKPIRTGVLGEYPAMTIEDLTKGADVVVRARVSKAKSYLTADDRYVLTDYLLLTPALVAGELPVQATPSPGQRVELVMSVYGGEVRSNGVPIVAENHNMAEDLKDGGEYLLFLKKFGTEPGRYGVYNGGIFRVDGVEAKALLRDAETLFKGFSAAPVEELTTRIQRAKPKR